MKDLFGQAILDYQSNNSPEDIITATSISEADPMSVAYLFRDFKAMPEIEQLALTLAKGRVLDIGCGAGSHALYLQNKKQLDVTAVDISPNAIAACTNRGVKDAIVADVMELNSVVHGTFDTILLLMNGAGMCGKLQHISPFLQQLKSLLADGGQILFDSSDIIYMFDEDEDGGKWIPGTQDYYGEVIFYLQYKGMDEDPFHWMYIDYNTLQNAAVANGYRCELLKEGTHYDYLAKLTLESKY
jgi:SAM-dependent methyltransferase